VNEEVVSGRWPVASKTRGQRTGARRQGKQGTGKVREQRTGDRDREERKLGA
jgi:hypothetical protein